MFFGTDPKKKTNKQKIVFFRIKVRRNGEIRENIPTFNHCVYQDFKFILRFLKDVKLVNLSINYITF